MRLRITNRKPARFGIERADGRFVFLEPGETRVVDVRNPDLIYGHEFLDAESPDFHGGGIPASLAAKVQAVRPYIVGENGPELMVPSRSGQVVPNHRLASGGQQVTVVQNITVDARNSVNPEGFERRILALSGQQAQAAYHGAVRDTPALMAKRQRFG